jgi:thiamine pyrophosphokinase
MIVSSDSMVTLVGQGDVRRETLSEALTIAPILVAADGGANRLLRWGLFPDSVIGDFDSISAQSLAAIPSERQFPIAEQHSTDFEKCLNNISSPLILALGFTGNRLDHTLAAFSALVVKRASPCIIVGNNDICFHIGRNITLDLKLGLRLSLFPMTEMQGVSSGLNWPIKDLAFSPMRQLGSSNKVSGPVSLKFDRDGMLGILPKSALPSVIKALSNAPGATVS